MRVPVLGTVTLGNAVSLRNVAIGAGVVLLAPAAISLIGTLMRPIAKAAIKSGLMVYDKGREIAAEAQESIEDLTAEAKAEMAEQREVKVVAPKKAKGATSAKA
jgi:hypothetical protein